MIYILSTENLVSLYFYHGGLVSQIVFAIIDESIYVVRVFLPCPEMTSIGLTNYIAAIRLCRSTLCGLSTLYYYAFSTNVATIRPNCMTWNHIPSKAGTGIRPLMNWYCPVLTRY